MGCWRPASRPGGPSPQAQRHLHVDSETESEGGEDDYPCQADQIALASGDNRAQSEPLLFGACKDAAMTRIKLLQPDEAVSCRDGLKKRRRVLLPRDKNRIKYVASRALRGCAVEGCKGYAPQCQVLQAPCRKGRKRSQPAAKGALDLGKRPMASVPERSQPDKKALEPTGEAAESVTDRKAKQVLADHVRSRSKGGNDFEARAACTWAQIAPKFDLDSDRPRHNRMLSRTCWQQALKASNIGLAPAEGGRAGGEPEPRAGKPAKGDTAALLGPPRTTKEASSSLDHRPKCREWGEYYCWDFISHRGCKQGHGCPHQHLKASKIPKLVHTNATSPPRGTQEQQKVELAEGRGRHRGSPQECCCQVRRKCGRRKSTRQALAWQKRQEQKGSEDCYNRPCR